MSASLASLLERLSRDVQRARGDDDDDEADHGGGASAPSLAGRRCPPPPWPRLAAEMLSLLREYPGGVAEAVIRTHVAYVLSNDAGDEEGGEGDQADGGGGRGDNADDGGGDGDEDDNAAARDADPLLEPLAAVPDRRGGDFRRPAEGRASDRAADDPAAWVPVLLPAAADATAAANATAPASSAWLRLRRAATLAECLAEAARRSGPTERPMLLHARVENVSAAVGGRGAASSAAAAVPPVLWLSDGSGGERGGNGAGGATAMFLHSWHVPLLQAPSYLTTGSLPLLFPSPLHSSTSTSSNGGCGGCRVRFAAVAVRRAALPPDMPPLMPPAAMVVELDPERFDRELGASSRWLGAAVTQALEELGGQGGGAGARGAGAVPPSGAALPGWVLARVASVSATERGSRATAGALSRTWTTRVVRLLWGEEQEEKGEAAAAAAGGGGDAPPVVVPLLLADAREALGDALLPGEVVAIWSPRLLRAPTALVSPCGGALMLALQEDAAGSTSGGVGGAGGGGASHVVVRGPDARRVARCVAWSSARTAAASFLLADSDQEEYEGLDEAGPSQGAEAGEDAREEEGGGREAASALHHAQRQERRDARERLRRLRSAPVLPLDALIREIEVEAAARGGRHPGGPLFPATAGAAAPRVVALGVVSGLRLSRGERAGGGAGAGSSASSSFVHLRADLLDPTTGSAVPLALSLRPGGRLLADLRDGHALLLCGARLVRPSSPPPPPPPLSPAAAAAAVSSFPYVLEWAESWSARADKASKSCDAQDLCAMPAALSTARVRALGGGTRIVAGGGGGIGAGAGTTTTLAELLSPPPSSSSPRPMFVVLRGLRLKALRAVVCRVHAACGRRVEALSAADMDFFDDDDDDGEAGAGGGGGKDGEEQKQQQHEGIIAGLSLADGGEEAGDCALGKQPRNEALGDWWRAWGRRQRNGGSGGASPGAASRFRVVAERADGSGGGDSSGSGQDDDGGDDSVHSGDTSDDDPEQDAENKPPPLMAAANGADPFSKAAAAAKAKRASKGAAPHRFFSCSFCTCELVGGGSSGAVARAYREDGRAGARMALEDASMCALLAADGPAWRAALSGAAARVAGASRLARRACAGACAAAAACSEQQAAAGWDALLYWRQGEWRVGAMQPSLVRGGQEEEE